MILGSFEKKREFSLRDYKVNGITVKHQLYPSDEKERYFHIYYNERKQTSERENVEEKMHKAGYAAKETEGHRSGAWVLIDFGDVIIHIFDRENRQFYNLERIWNDGKRIDDVNEL